MNAARAVVGLTVIVSALSAQAGCGNPSADVVDVSLVTFLPNEVGPGGFEGRLDEGEPATGFFFQAAISDCGAEVIEATREWAARHRFAAGQVEVEGRQATLRLSSDELPGSDLVVRYSLASDHSLARVRISQEAANGATPLTPEKLGDLGVQELVEAQLEAARCETTV